MIGELMLWYAKLKKFEKTISGLKILVYDHVLEKNHNLRHNNKI